jgi:hypothetical protein
MRAYWLTVFSPETWGIFCGRQFPFAAFPSGRAVAASKIATGDRLICYVTKVYRFAGILEATATSFLQPAPQDEFVNFPLRVPVNRLVTLNAEYAVPLSELYEQLTIFSRARHVSGWRAYVRISPLKWPTEDGDLIHGRLQSESRAPQVRPIVKGALAVPQASRLVAGGRVSLV